MEADPKSLSSASSLLSPSSNCVRQRHKLYSDSVNLVDRRTDDGYCTNKNPLENYYILNGMQGYNQGKGMSARGTQIHSEESSHYRPCLTSLYPQDESLTASKEMHTKANQSTYTLSGSEAAMEHTSRLYPADSLLKYHVADRYPQRPITTHPESQYTMYQNSRPQTQDICQLYNPPLAANVCPQIDPRTSNSLLAKDSIFTSMHESLPSDRLLPSTREQCLPSHPCYTGKEGLWASHMDHQYGITYGNKPRQDRIVPYPPTRLNFDIKPK